MTRQNIYIALCKVFPEASAFSVELVADQFAWTVGVFQPVNLPAQINGSPEDIVHRPVLTTKFRLHGMDVLVGGMVGLQRLIEGAFREATGMRADGQMLSLGEMVKADETKGRT